MIMLSKQAKANIVCQLTALFTETKRTCPLRLHDELVVGVHAIDGRLSLEQLQVFLATREQLGDGGRVAHALVLLEADPHSLFSTVRAC